MVRHLTAAHAHQLRTERQRQVLEEQYIEIQDLLSELDTISDKLTEVAQNVGTTLGATNGG